MKLTVHFVAAIFSLSLASAESPWNQFRGPTGRGDATGRKVPVQWSAQSVKWSVDLPGAGQSSPVNWGDRVFLTSAEELGKVRHVFCLDLNSGKELWRKTTRCPHPEMSHQMNGWATPTCATDGERVYAFFENGGLFAYTLEGNLVWQKDLGEFPGDWGVAASPVLVDDKVIINADRTGPSSLLAFDRKTGTPLWETKRADKPKGGWSTPVLIEFDGTRELVVNGEFGVNGYNPETGDELWFCKGFNGRGCTVPDFVDGALFVINGKPGDLYSVKPGGRGDVTQTHMLWHMGRKAGRDLPSPAVLDGYMIAVSMNCYGTCFDKNTGQILWNERLPVQGEFAASPLKANGLAYFTGVFGGETIAIKPGPKMEIVATCSVGAKPDEIFRSTLTPVNGRLLIRSQTRLYCVE